MSTPSELIARIARERDRSAFESFYQHLSPRVYGYLLKLLRNRTDADDVLQETFLQVWNQAERFDPARANAAGWVLMIARSRAGDRLRKRKSAAVEAAHEPAVTAEPGEQLERSDDAARLTAALCRLPAEQADLIRLAFFDGLTHEQIAVERELPLGTVKTRIRLGMIRLRDGFADRTPGGAV